jgi:hypothetical protein
MTKIAILPVPSLSGTSYCAVSGAAHSQGETAGEALDALTAQLPPGSGGMVVVVQSQGPDEFFTAAQQRRLAELMDLWRTARERNATLNAEEQSELNQLVERELVASGERAEALAREARR